MSGLIINYNSTLYKGLENQEVDKFGSPKN